MQTQTLKGIWQALEKLFSFENKLKNPLDSHKYQKIVSVLEIDTAGNYSFDSFDSQQKLSNTHVIVEM